MNSLDLSFEVISFINVVFVSSKKVSQYLLIIINLLLYFI